MMLLVPTTSFLFPKAVEDLVELIQRIYSNLKLLEGTGPAKVCDYLCL